MLASTRSWAVAQHKVYRLLSLVLVATLLASALFAARPNGSVQAATGATCASITGSLVSLDWHAAATWSCSHVPTGADDVFIDDADIFIAKPGAIHSLTIGDTTAGSLLFTGAVPLKISGNLTVGAFGVFDPGSGVTGGTIDLNGAGNQTITAVDYTLDFWNLTKYSAAAGQTLFFNLSANQDIHVLNNLTLKGAAAHHLLLRSSSAGTPWGIDAEGPRDLNWLDVQDANNTGASPISLVNWTDSGNNAAWAKDSDTSSSLAIAALTNPSFGHRPVTLTFRVYPAAATGNVTFYEGVQEIAACHNMLLSDGATGCTIKGLSTGAHSIYTVFTSANPSYTDSTATVLVQNMNLAYYLPIGNN